MSNYLTKTLKITLSLLLVLSLILVQAQDFLAYEVEILSVVAFIDDGFANYLVINKVYYDVDCDYGSEHENEWIELYNPTDSSIDISNWTIEDNNSQDTLPSAVIPALGFAIVTGDDSTFDYWNVPDEAIKVVLDDGKIGNGLHNCHDMLILKNSQGDIIDQMNWEEPDSDWPNYNEDVWDPGVDDVDDDENMLARIFNGFDTNKPSDFKEFSKPQIGINLPKSGKWYCGEEVVINWFTGNPNGPDENILIDIDVITDSDHSGKPSSSDDIYNIAKNIENTGTIKWNVSPCFDGYIWIKVNVKTSENFMLNNFRISRRIEEPPARLTLEGVEGEQFPVQEEEIPLEEEIEQEVEEEIIKEEPIIEEPVIEEEQEEEEQEQADEESAEEVIEEEEEILEPEPESEPQLEPQPEFETEPKPESEPEPEPELPAQEEIPDKEVPNKEDPNIPNDPKDPNIPNEETKE